MNSFNSHLDRMKNELMTKSPFDFERFFYLINPICYSTEPIILRNVSKMENISEDFLRKMADFEEDEFQKYKTNLGSSDVNLKKSFLYFIRYIFKRSEEKNEIDIKKYFLSLIKRGFSDAIMLYYELTFLNINLKKGFEEKIFSKKYEVDIYKILTFVGTNNMVFLTHFRIRYVMGNMEEMLGSIEKNKNEGEGCPFVLYDMKKIIKFLESVEKDLIEVFENFSNFLKPYTKYDIKGLMEEYSQEGNLVAIFLSFYLTFWEKGLDVSFIDNNRFIKEVK